MFFFFLSLCLINDTQVNCIWSVCELSWANIKNCKQHISLERIMLCLAQFLVSIWFLVIGSLPSFGSGPWILSRLFKPVKLYFVVLSVNPSIGISSIGVRAFMVSWHGLSKNQYLSARLMSWIIQEPIAFGKIGDSCSAYGISHMCGKLVECFPGFRCCCQRPWLVSLSPVCYLKVNYVEILMEIMKAMLPLCLEAPAFGILLSFCQRFLRALFQ